MTAPIAITVEVAFSAGYRTPAADRVWTDITAYVEAQSALSIAYGRSDELATADANRLTNLVLDNKDGRFTPGKTSSPYYPNVKIGRPIRVTATVGATTSRRFTGYVEEWPLEWPGGSANYATVPVSGVSRMARLGLTASPPDFIDIETLAQKPTYYWPLTDPAASRGGREVNGAAPDLARVRPVGYALGAGLKGAGENAEFRADGRSGASIGARQADEYGTYAPRARVTLPAQITFGPGAPGGVSIGVFVRTIGTSVNSGGSWLTLFRASNGWGSILGSEVRFSPFSASSNYEGNGGSGSNVTADLGISIAGPTADNNPHHLGLSLACDGTTVTIKSYLDGQLVDTATSTNPIEPYYLDRLELIQNMSGPYLFGRLAVWDHVVDDATFADIGGAIGGYAGDTVDRRMQRVTDWAGIVPVEVTLPGSSRVMSGINVTDGLPRPLDLLRVVETAEGGVLNDDRSGQLRLRDRTGRYNVAPAVTADFSAHLVGPDYAPKVDRQNLANIGVGKNTDGTIEVTFIDEASRDEYGDASYDLEIATVDPEEPLMRVAAVVNANSQPRSRAPSVTFKVTDWIDDPTALAAIVGLDIDSKIRLANAPAQSASSTVDYFVEGYSESLSPFEWAITLNLSPAAPVGDYLVLDSTAGGVLDENLVAL